jgi:hypothetical protein
MKYSRQISLAAVACLGFGALTARAVVRNDGTIGDPADIPGAVQVITGDSLGSGTVIGDGDWVLTAGHVLDSGNNGASYSFKTQDGTTVLGTGTIMRVVSASDTVDWGLVQLATPLPGAIQLYNGNPAIGQTIFFAGWGLSDTTPGSGQARLGPAPRQGANVINFVDNTKFALGFDFDLAGGTNAFPATTINGVAVADDGRANSQGGAEATTFGGDSGMGYLESINGTDVLVGVHDGITDAAALNTDQVESYGTTVAGFYSQIASLVPEPGAMSLMGLGGGLLLVLNWRRFQAQTERR